MTKTEHGLKLAMILAAIILMSGAGLNNSLVVHAQGSPASPDTFVFVDSQFKLWNSREKALDSNFTIHIFMPLALNNSTNNYIIRVDNNITNGSFGNYWSQSYKLTNVSKIEVMEVMVNNRSVMLATGIRVMTGVSQSQIDSGRSPYTINLMPSEWRAKEWRIFFAIVVCALICSFISYRLVMRYRKARGVIEIQ